MRGETGSREQIEKEKKKEKEKKEGEGEEEDQQEDLEHLSLPLFFPWVLEGLDLELAKRRSSLLELGLELLKRLLWKGSSFHLSFGKRFLHYRQVGTFVGAYEGLRKFRWRHDDWLLETMTLLACHLCSFAHACEGRSLQAGTPELAYATYARPCGIEKPTGSGGIDSFSEWECWSYHRHLGGASRTTLV
uniref:Uncharacterized protein n=1 Tax=Ananas comosus var. bracteatus TaxID=296719 RepID=A0A6V7QMC7_ANACO|nr:unnamed protein product [Ananas comosus var. bracteatus]